MHRSTHEPRSTYQRHPDVSGCEIQDRRQGALRDDNAGYHHADMVPLDHLVRVQDEPVAAVANVFDVPKPRHENVRHLVRVDKKIRLLQFYEHDALPTRARHDGARHVCDTARNGSRFYTKAEPTGYRSVNGGQA